MRKTAAGWLAVLLIGCSGSEIVVPGPLNPEGLPPTGQVQKTCPSGNYSANGFEPGCLPCPESAKVDAAQKSCLCSDPAFWFDSTGNICRKKLTVAQMRFLLL
jgi:hypothetical protein